MTKIEINAVWLGRDIKKQTHITIEIEEKNIKEYTRE